jgi:hypothetical protein
MMVIISVVFIIPALSGTDYITYKEFDDEYGVLITEDELGDEINIKDIITQFSVMESRNEIGVNFASTGRSTDPNSAFQVYDLLMPGEYKDDFRVGYEITFVIVVTEEGYEAKDFKLAD